MDVWGWTFGVSVRSFLFVRRVKPVNIIIEFQNCFLTTLVWSSSYILNLYLPRCFTNDVVNKQTRDDEHERDAWYVVFRPQIRRLNNIF